MAFLSTRVFDARLQAMQDFMDERRLDALLFGTPDYFFYATNYFLDVAPWERPVAVVVPRRGEPFALMHELSTHHVQMAGERGTLWVTDVTLYSEHPRVTARLQLTPQWPVKLASMLRTHGLGRARIGVDALTAPVGGAARELPEAQFVAIERAMRELRWVKHQEELDLMRQAAALSDWAQERYREMVRPARVAQELDSALAAAIYQEAAHRFPNEHLELRLRSLSGPESAAPHGTGAPNAKAFAAGHSIVNIIIVRLNGLTVENERSWVLGTPNDVQIRAFTAATEAQQAAIAQMVTGNPVCSVDAAAQAVFARAGFDEQVRHRTGHGVGIAGHEFPDDMAFNTRPLRANEVYSAEPGIYLYGLGGFRHDDTVVVGDAPEVLTKAPKELAAQTIAVRD